LVLIALVVLGVFALGSTWAWKSFHPPTPHEAEKIVRDASVTAAAAESRDSSAGPIPAPQPEQSAAARLDALDAWFAEWRAEPAPAPVGDPIRDDALAVARVQARGRTLLDLSHAYREHADDADPAIAARARTKLADIYTLGAEDLSSLPVPRYLTPEQRKAFEESIAIRIADQESRAASERDVAVALLTGERPNR
jgi:hypothetical protein